MVVPLQKIRNFSIIAHIDHGKSTLADRFLEVTGTFTKREMREQILDSMDLERERGITIKAHAIRMEYKGYQLHLIDTPGHVDFSYEVSRSLAACEGALLIVDASQGIEAQTLVNAQLARSFNLKLIPVINKIDLQNAEPEKTAEALQKVFGFTDDEILFASGKDGTGTEEVLDAIIERIPAPKGDPDAPLQALIFDSRYDTYRGVIMYLRVMNGTLRKEDMIRLMGTHTEYEVQEIGSLRLGFQPRETLSAGEVGYCVAGIRAIQDARVGDTLTLKKRPASEALPGYKPIKPMVYCGFYPIKGEDFPRLKDGLDKLRLNDAALSFEPETSAALGYGFRCGFLGLLHLEIVQERLEREFGLELIATAPNVEYKAHTRRHGVVDVDNPTALPPLGEINWIEEPFVKLSIFCPSESVGKAMQLATGARGNLITMDYLDDRQAVITFEIPLAEIVSDFHDQLKSVTQGYASMDYEPIGYRKSDLVKMDVLLNGEAIDALAVILHKDYAHHRGKALVAKLKELIPRHTFAVPIQAAIGSKVIARENISAISKNVIQRIHGGGARDRKKKLLKKQKEGKKRMKLMGKVAIPQEAFLSIVRISNLDTK